MIENQNISNDVSVTEKVNGGGETVVLTEEENTVVIYDLSPEDFDAAVEKATEVYIDSKGEGVSSGTICPPRVSEVWFKFTIPQSATYSIRTVGQFDTIGKLYASSGNPIMGVDDNELCGKLNFRMRVDLTEGATYYLRVTIADAESGTCYLIVSRRLPVDYVETVPKTIVLDVGKTYQLPYDIEYTNLNIPNVPCVENLKLAVVPAEAEERSVSWYNNAGDIVEIKRKTFNNTVYQSIKGNTPGVGHLYVGDALDNGRWAEVTVIVKNPNDTIAHYNIVSKATGEVVSFTGAIAPEGENNVCARRLNNTNMQLWKIDNISSNKDCYVRCYLDEDYGLNYNSDSYNCDLVKIADDEVNTAVYFVQQTNGYYKIKLKNHPDYYLTIGSNNSAANINWQKTSDEEKDRQLWRLEAVDMKQHADEQVEYHIVCNGNKDKALRVAVTNYLLLEQNKPVRAERLSYWNRQKWMIKGVGNRKKLYTAFNQDYYLCNYTPNDPEGNYKAFVSNNASDDDSYLTIQEYGRGGMYTIKLSKCNLYLTLVSGKHTEGGDTFSAEWGMWCPFDYTDPSSQLWEFSEQPANYHYGVDTKPQMSNATIRSVKLSGKEFVMRYYGMLDQIGNIPIRTKDGSQSIVGDTIQNLRAKEIRLDDADYDYLQGADDLLANGEPVIYASKTVTPEELKNIRNQNLKLVVVYQNNARAITDFTIDHAKLDAFCALVDAKRLGQPYGTTIYFAVDFDPDFSDVEENQKEIIKRYFSTIKDKINGQYKIGVYGTAKTCELIESNYADFSWLSNRTCATDSSIEGNASYIAYDKQQGYDVKQSDQIYYNGIIFDNDTSIVDSYGQW